MPFNEQGTMLRIKSILFPTDFSPCAERAYNHAVHLARRLVAKLHVLSVVYHEEDAETSPMSFLPLGSDELAVQLGLESSTIPGADDDSLEVVNVQLQSTSAWRTILEYVEEQKIDLVVMGTHGRHGLDRLLLGSVAEQVVRRAPCPVLTVRQEHPVRRRPGAVPEIVVPVDFSPFSRPTLNYAVDLAHHYGAKLALVHVVEQINLPNVYGIDPIPVVAPDLQARSLQALEALAADEIPPGQPFDCTVLIGHAGHDIVEFADDRDADMIVIATHGLTGLKRLLMGSVTEQVLRAATCPVFTVRSFESAEMATRAQTEKRYEVH
jgi:nucleotide-binding universal stress UspA family protein